MNLKYVWNKMKILKNSFNTVEWNKWQKKDRRKVIELEIEKIAPAWVNTEENIAIEYHDEEDLNDPFTEEELDRALRNVKEKSSPGLDNIKYGMIKKTGYKISKRNT